MEKDVGLQRSHEQQRRRARVFDANDAGLGGAAEVVGNDAQAAARRRVLGADVERQDDRRLRAAVHVDGEVLGDRVRDERHEFLGQPPQHDARILGTAGGLEMDDGGGHLDVPRAHGRGEKRLLRLRVAQQRRRREAELRGDVGEGRGLEAFRRENAAGGLENIVAADGGRASH